MTPTPGELRRLAAGLLNSVADEAPAPEVELLSFEEMLVCKKSNSHNGIALEVPFAIAIQRAILAKAQAAGVVMKVKE